jgi:hypothetical protein
MHQPSNRLIAIIDIRGLMMTSYPVLRPVSAR